MKKSFIIVYSVISSIIILLAVTYFGVNLKQEYSHGDLRTEIRFEKMSTAIKTSINQNNISENEMFRQFENAIGDKNDFSYILVSVNNQTIYRYPEDFTKNNIDDNSKLISNRKKTFSESGKSIEILSGLYLLRPSSIFDYAKVSFLAILIISIITIILIIINNHKDSKIRSLNKKVIYKENKAQTVEEILNNSTSFVNTDNNLENNDETTSESESLEVPQAQEVTTSKNNDFNDNIQEIQNLPVEDSIPVDIQEDNPQGLFSPVTGFGWESYLLTRLDNELNRATASEIDLALFLFKFIGIDRKDSIMKTICDYLTLEFQFKDLLFEYKNDSICAIKLSMNVDDSYNFAQVLEKEITKLVNVSDFKLLIGISTRGIRMVSGERLLKEADEAINHAQEDEYSPVVAFRADAIKYRKFIESN